MAVILPDIRFLLTVVVCRFSLYRRCRCNVELVPSFIQMKRLCECFVSNATRKGNKIIAVGVKCLRSSFCYRGKCSSPPDEWTTYQYLEDLTYKHVSIDISSKNTSTASAKNKKKTILPCHQTLVYNEDRINAKENYKSV